MGHQLVAHPRLLGVRGHEQDRHLHVRRLREPALLAGPDERRQIAVDGGQSGPGDPLGAGHHAVKGLRGLQAHAVRRAARDDDQPAVGGGLLLPVAEPVALHDARDVEHRAPVLRGIVVAEPQPGTDARAEPGLRELLLQPAQFLGAQMTHEHGVQRQPGRPETVHPGDDLFDRVRAVRAIQRQVQGEAFETYVLDGGVQLPELLLLDAVALHRAHALDDDPGAHQGVHAVHGRDGADDPVGQRHRLLAPPERREHQQITAEPVLDPGRFVGGADREDVGAEADRLVGQPLVAEAVPVALADRYEPGELVEHGFLVRPPARGVDVQGERHGRSGTFLVAAVVSEGCGASGTASGRAH